MAKYDFMSFGEPNIRLTPPNHDRLGQAEELHLGIAAAELNCCVNISNLSVERLLPTLRTAYVTKLVDNWTGSYIVNRARMYGVDMSNVVVEPFDKIGRVRNGLAFVEVGIGPRPSYQIYDRGHTALSRIQPGATVTSTGKRRWIPAGSTPQALSPPWANTPPEKSSPP